MDAQNFVSKIAENQTFLAIHDNIYFLKVAVFIYLLIVLRAASSGVISKSGLEVVTNTLK